MASGLSRTTLYRLKKERPSESGSSNWQEVLVSYIQLALNVKTTNSCYVSYNVLGANQYKRS